VGGSSRMPMVQRMLEEVTGKPPDLSLSTDEAVVHGAAIYAGLLLDSEAGAPPKVTVRNVNSHNLGVLGIEKATGRPRTRVMIPRNTTLPASEKAPFTTHRDNQRNVVVKVVEGGDASGNDATHIGKCVVTDLPSGLPAGSHVDVTFRYGQDGRLTVKAELPETGTEATSEIERTSGLTADALREWNQRIREPASLCSGGGPEDEPPPLPKVDDDEPPPLPSVDDDQPPPLPPASDDEPPPLPT